MYSIKVFKVVGVSVNKASNLIFDACRANPDRVDKGNVRFGHLYGDIYEATLFDSDNQVVAKAIIDEFDV